ncbi:MAG TPA: hypothetical protein VJR04_12200 [Terriglobales bacterium]|nr:hypothetical protein [Terriglobales bacterium]
MLLAREVRVPVSAARPEREELCFPRTLVLREEADREELRPPLSPARAVVFRREERPSLRFWLRDRVDLAERELLRALLDVVRGFEVVGERRAVPRCALCDRFAVWRLTSLLKLLRCPPAVVS